MDLLQARRGSDPPDQEGDRHEAFSAAALLSRGRPQFRANASGTRSAGEHAMKAVLFAPPPLPFRSPRTRPRPRMATSRARDKYVAKIQGKRRGSTTKTAKQEGSRTRRSRGQAARPCSDAWRSKAFRPRASSTSTRCSAGELGYGLIDGPQLPGRRQCAAADRHHAGARQALADRACEVVGGRK